MTITLTREEAQQVLDALQCATPPTFSAKIVEDWQSAVEFLRARLSAPEPSASVKPVALAWAEGYKAGIDDERSSEANIGIAGFGAKVEPARQNPYTAPPQREWQGLTAYEIQELHLANQNWGNFACAIEAKLKEKNT